MSNICENQVKNSGVITEHYPPQYMGQYFHKRKNSELENKDTMPQINTAQNILKQALNNASPEQFQPKRRQSKPLFRPWEFDSKSATTVAKPQKSISPPQVLQAHSTNAMACRTNMIRHYTEKEITEMKHQRRQRNIQACLRNRRIKQAEQLRLQQQNVAYQQYQAAMMEEYRQHNLYIQQLQEMARQQQLYQQMFVFGLQR